MGQVQPAACWDEFFPEPCHANVRIDGPALRSHAAARLTSSRRDRVASEVEDLFSSSLQKEAAEPYSRESRKTDLYEVFPYF